MTFFVEQIKTIAQTDILEKGREQDCFIGRPFYIDYGKALVMTCDAWKAKVNGIPQGTFLLAFYDGEKDVEEALLLRAIAPTKLPTDDDNIKSMVAYYKENMEIAGRAGTDSPQSQLDQFTKYEFSFSGLECSILGVFYKVEGKDKDGNSVKTLEFGADVENFYSANNYKVYKATNKVLQVIVNQRDGDEIPGNENEFPIGKVRYSSSRRFQNGLKDVRVWINPKDFLGKRTSLFGMTRTGKSNTVKKIIQATDDISSKAKRDLDADTKAIERIKTDRKKEPYKDGLLQQEQNFVQELTKAFHKDGSPKYKVGQIIFDVNGEYANANMQDEGTAIFELFDTVKRYSVLEKEGFDVLKINFYKELEAGFSLIESYFKQQGKQSDYVNDFLAISLEKPEDYESDWDIRTRFDRKKAAYLCCLKKADFVISDTATVSFQGSAKLNENIFKPVLDNNGNAVLDNDGNRLTVNIEPDLKKKQFPTFNDAIIWFTQVWKYYDTWDYLVNYERKNGQEWADSELKSVLRFLTQYKSPSEKGFVSGYAKLRPLKKYHTDKAKNPFEKEILDALREGKIVIIDLSQGDPDIKNFYSERICRAIFDDSMKRFIDNQPNNFIQIYFEEAHNLFPKKEDKDLTDVYNRIAKEGAKLNLGMVYATQEVSSISSNILKNTQNWFIAHLNNEDEIKEIRKYYDFSDFTDSLIRFSATNDKGFVRMKTYTNPFVVPVQIDRFLADKK